MHTYILFDENSGNYFDTIERMLIGDKFKYKGITLKVVTDELLHNDVHRLIVSQ